MIMFWDFHNLIIDDIVVELMDTFENVKWLFYGLIDIFGVSL